MSRLLDGCEGRGVLVITHDTTALDGFDRVLRLRGGSLTGTVEDIPVRAAA